MMIKIKILQCFQLQNKLSFRIHCFLLLTKNTHEKIVFQLSEAVQRCS